MMERNDIILLSNMLFGKTLDSICASNKFSEKFWECIYAKAGVPNVKLSRRYECGTFVDLQQKCDAGTLCGANFRAVEDNDFEAAYCMASYDCCNDMFRRTVYKWDGSFFETAYCIYDSFLGEAELIVSEFEDVDSSYLLEDMLYQYMGDYDDSEEDSEQRDLTYKALCYGALYFCYLDGNYEDVSEQLNKYWDLINPLWSIEGVEYMESCIKDVCRYLGISRETFSLAGLIILRTMYSYEKATELDGDESDTVMAASVFSSKEYFYLYEKNRELIQDIPLRDALDKVFEFLKFPFQLPTGRYESCEFTSCGYIGTRYVAAYYAPQEYSYCDMVQPTFLLGRTIFCEGIKIIKGLLANEMAA